MRKLLLCILPILLFGLSAASAPTSKPKRAKVSISTRLDKTAIWVGDTLQYRIRAVHDKNVEFVRENLQRENLNLAPFVVREVTVRQSAFRDDKNILEINLSLATYESGKPELRIPPLSLYYFVREPGLEKQAESQAESVTVPATRVGLRSTLAGDNPRLRDSKQAAEVMPQQWMIPLILGLSGLAFLALQSGRRALTAVHTVKPKKRRRSRRARQRMAQDFLKRIKLVGKESTDDQLRFYSEVSQFLRNYLSESLEIEASSLTPDEIENVLRRLGRDGSSSEPVRAILEKCDQVLYGKNHFEAGQKWRDDVLQDLEKLLRRV